MSKTKSLLDNNKSLLLIKKNCYFNSGTWSSNRITLLQNEEILPLKKQFKINTYSFKN